MSLVVSLIPEKCLHIRTYVHQIILLSGYHTVAPRCRFMLLLLV
jgi:hypothetical protein